MKTFQVDTTVEDWVTLASVQATVYLPPMWEKFGKTLVSLHWKRDGRYIESGSVELKDKSAINELIEKAAERWHNRKDGEKDFYLQIHWISTAWYPEYHDHLRKVIHLEFVV